MRIAAISILRKVSHQTLPGASRLLAGVAGGAQLTKQHGAKPEEAPQGPGLHHRIARRQVIYQLKSKDPVTCSTVLRVIFQKPRVFSRHKSWERAENGEKNIQKEDFRNLQLFATKSDKKWLKAFSSNVLVINIHPDRHDWHHGWQLQGAVLELPVSPGHAKCHAVDL